MTTDATTSIDEGVQANDAVHGDLEAEADAEEQAAEESPSEAGQSEEIRSEKLDEPDDSQPEGRLEFKEVEYPEPHRSRTKELLQEHPEITEYFETNSWTAAICVAAVGAQVGITYFVVNQPWWVMLLTAYFVGAFLCHTTFAIVHEAAHKRIFRKRWANEVVGWMANLPHLLPSSSSFRNYHLKHHLYQGDPEYDADLASRAEAEWVGNSTIKKIIWQTVYPVMQSVRTKKFSENDTIPFMTKWVAGNIIVQFAFNIGIYLWLGPWALFYMGISYLFTMGLHPLSARLIQEHFEVKEGQETYSYYGPLNKLSLNVYHHNEHHDFPAVPWNHLPKVRQMASDVYEDDLYHHESLTKLWLKFLFDPSMTLYQRVTRDYYNGTVDRS